MEGGNSSMNKGKASMKVPIPPHPLSAPNVGLRNARNRQPCAVPGRGCEGHPPTPAPPTTLTSLVSDQYMPIANVTRIMRKVLPPHAKISDEAKIAIQESVTEFISFVTEEANRRCHYEQRKIITGEDLLCSMERLGFDNYVTPLMQYLQKFRAMEGLDHRRQQTIFRPRPATQQHMMCLPTIMGTTMPTNPNTNVIMFTPNRPQMEFNYGIGSSSGSPSVYVPNTPASEGSCTSFINRINFDNTDEVEFESVELPVDACPSGSSSANYMGAENEFFDHFPQFK